MKHRDQVFAALNHERTDRPPFQATFIPEFANRLRKQFDIVPCTTELHHRQWYGYDLEVLTGQDALQAGVGRFTNYYLRNEPYCCGFNSTEHFIRTFKNNTWISTKFFKQTLLKRSNLTN